jgi:hypothetical protein
MDDFTALDGEHGEGLIVVAHGNFSFGAAWHKIDFASRRIADVGLDTVADAIAGLGLLLVEFDAECDALPHDLKVVGAVRGAVAGKPDLAAIWCKGGIRHVEVGTASLRVHKELTDTQIQRLHDAGPYRRRRRPRATHSEPGHPERLDQ